MPLTLINMIPNSLSGETNRDSEANVSVSGADANLIVATAFTPDPAASGNAPVFASTDGGATWSLVIKLPGGNSTSDVTVRFAGASPTAYASILRQGTTTMNVLRKTDILAPGLMTILVTRAGEDQPYVSSVRTLGAGSGLDKVFVGHNFTSAPTTQTASSETSQDAETAAAPAGLIRQTLDAGVPVNQDGPSVRLAAHLIGRVYATFFRYTAVGPGTLRTRDVVVCRDDNWAAGGAPFTAITDPVTGLAGVNVANNSQANFGALLGTQRTGSQMAIAVDPRDWRIVWLAWCDGTPVANYAVRLRRSIDGGQTWSGDLRAVIGATCPGVAVNTHGKVALVYQQLVDPGTGNRWRTHLELSTDAFATPPADLLLADVPDANGTYGGNNPIGDYLGVVALGKNFYGAFAANNTPDNANFPNGVTYLRAADFVANQLLDLASNPVAVSIDPFFFKWIDVAPADDFYVRDWTDSPASGDDGIEPSTHPHFYATSDVWNRRGTLPGSFPNDQPENEPAGNGAGNIGDNWSFCRIRRNAPAAAPQTVTAHFLVSKLGTGSNYVDGSSMDPDVSFPDPDPMVTFTAADIGPVTTPAYHWHLEPVASTHLCLAVEIAGPSDPYVAPSLIGSAPGWSTTTDLRILDDNNKAQRNMGLSTTPARGEGARDDFFAIAHNAALRTRDLELRWEVPPETAEHLGEMQARIVGGRSRKLGARLGTILLRGMLPGENRWIGLTWTTPSRAKEGLVLPVHFHEVEGAIPINGFALGARVASLAETLAEKLERHRSMLVRLQATGLAEVEDAEIEEVTALAKEHALDPKKYGSYIAHAEPRLGAFAKALVSRQANGKDLFGLRRYLTALRGELSRGRASRLLGAHSALVNAADASLTMFRLEAGDPADVLQMVRWEEELYGRIPDLARLAVATDVINATSKFVTAYGRREATNLDYRPLLERLTDAHEQTAKRLSRRAPGLAALAHEIASASDLAATQRAHRRFLLAMYALGPQI